MEACSLGALQRSGQFGGECGQQMWIYSAIHGLESLYREFKAQGFNIIGFPCNQFGFQEPGTDSEIQNFCKLSYDVSFPIMSKVDVNGDKAAPVYNFLKSHAPGIMGTEAIKWNFTKFLVGKNGEVLNRYAPQTEPKDIAADIKKALN